MLHAPEVPEQARVVRDLRLLFVLGGVSTAAVLPFFVPLLEQRGMSASQIGLSLSVAAFGGLIVTPAWSHAADGRLGIARALQLTTLLSMAAAIALAPVSSPTLLVATLAVILVVVEAPGTALSDSLALANLGPNASSRYGSIRLWTSLGWALSAVALGGVYERFGYGSALPVYALFLVGYLLTLAPFRRTTRSLTQPVAHDARSNAWRAVREVRELPWFLVGLIIVSASSMAANTFVALQIVDGGGGPFLLGLSASLMALVEVPFFHWSPRLAVRLGQRRLYVIGVLISVLMFAAWAFTTSPLTISLLKVTSGASFAFSYSAIVVITERLMPEALRSTGQGLLQVARNGLGPIIGVAIGGIVYERLGAPALFAGCAVLQLVGAAVVVGSLTRRTTVTDSS